MKSSMARADFLCLRLVLLQKLVSEILQGRHFALIVVLLIGAVDACRTAVNDRLLHCAEVVASDELLLFDDSVHVIFRLSEF